jgi:hypothetical protein
MYFRMKTNSTPVNAMTILGSGNIGIGITPTNRLDIRDTALAASESGAKIYTTFDGTALGTVSAYGLYIKTETDSLDNSGGTPNTYDLYIDSNDAYLTGSGTNHHGIYQTGSGKNYFSGSFGILDSTPYYNLDVAGTAGFDGNLVMTGSSANIALGSNWITGDGTDTEGISIDSNGKVGIATASPDVSLDIENTNGNTTYTNNVGLLRLANTTNNGSAISGSGFEVSAPGDLLGFSLSSNAHVAAYNSTNQRLQ